MPAVIYDIGGTYLRCAFVNQSSELKSLKKIRIESFIHGLSFDDIWKNTIEAISNYEKSIAKYVDHDDPIIISFPGSITHPSIIENAPTLLGNATNIPDLAAILRKNTGRKVFIINDISAAAWYFSKSIKADRFIVTTISSGIGSKIFDRTHPNGVIDNVPYAGEIGHVMVDFSPDALLCDCGGKGHLSAISSGRGIERHANLIAKNDQTRFQNSLCFAKFHGTPGSLTNEHHIVPAAKLNDEWALKIVSDCTEPLAKLLLSLIFAYGLNRIVIIGGFSLALGNKYLHILQNLLTEFCDYNLVKNNLVNMVELGNYCEEACLLGAAVYSEHIIQMEQSDRTK
jgi:predicted NBD/HSP70 family sugar kinase